VVSVLVDLPVSSGRRAAREGLVHRPMCGIASFVGSTASLWSANQGSEFELGEQ
jgi:hypothetical protein